MILLKIALIVIFGIIAFQDIKDRMVYWLLFPLVTLLCGALHFYSVLPELFLYSVLLNLIIVSICLLGISLYTLLKGQHRFKDVIGIGDILLFIALAFSFSTVSFLVVLVGSLFFSLIFHRIYKHKSQHKTIPLAGYMSVFFGFTYLGFWLGFTQVLYSI